MNNEPNSTMTTEPKKPFSMMMPEELQQALKIKAATEKVTLSSLIVRYLSAGLGQSTETAPTTGIVLPPPPPARVWPAWDWELFKSMSMEDQRLWTRHMEAEHKRKEAEAGKR